MKLKDCNQLYLTIAVTLAVCAYEATKTLFYRLPKKLAQLSTQRK